MRRGTVQVLGAILVAGFLAGNDAIAQQPTSVLRVNAAELAIGGRVQTQFNTTTVDDLPESEMIIRRVRLEFAVRVNPVVSGRLQPEFAGDRVSMRDAYVKFDFTPGVQVLAGKAFRPFSLLAQTSSTRILPVERGLAIRGVTGLDQHRLVNDLGYSDRDIGLQLMGSPRAAPLGLTYAAGVFAGPLAGRLPNDDTYQYAARAAFRLLPNASIGAGWSNRAFARATAGAPVEIDRGTAFEVDLEVGAFAPGFHLMAEASHGTFDPFTEARFTGGQAWLAYRTPAVGAVSTFEPVLRVSHSRLDAPSRNLGGTLLTPGVNIYMGGWNRIMLNYDHWRPQQGRSQSSIKAQFQLAF
jgi:hypothetical protein